MFVCQLVTALFSLFCGVMSVTQFVPPFALLPRIQLFILVILAYLEANSPAPTPNTHTHTLTLSLLGQNDAQDAEMKRPGNFIVSL